MASYSNEATALESPGPGGSLQWKEHLSGSWSAKGLGGRYDIYPRGAGGYTAYWEQSGTGAQHEIGNYDTIGAAFGACRRHADGERRQTAAEEEDHDAVAKDVARKAVESAYGSGQVDHLSKSHPTTPGDPSFWNAWLKSGKRLTVHVNGSTGTVRDPDDGHVVATHTVSEAAECDVCAHKHPKSVPTTPCAGEDRDEDNALVGLIRRRANAAGLVFIPSIVREATSAGWFGGSIEKVRASLLRLERNGGRISLYPDDGFGRLSPADKKLTIPGPGGTHLAYAKIRHGVTEAVASESREKPIVIEKTGEHAWVVFVQHNPIVNVAKRGTKPELSWKGRKNYVEGSKRHIFKTRGDAEGIAHHVGRYVLNLGDFVFSYVEYKNDVPSATETVPVIHEANDVGSFATMDRDTKELAKGKALGSARTPQAIYKMVSGPLAKESQEVFLVIPLDLHGEALSRPVEVARGQRDRVSVGISDVMRPVAQFNAKGFVVVHNHPSGHARPSPKDRELTETIRKHTFSDVKFCDHIVVGMNEFYSFEEKKLFKVG